METIKLNTHVGADGVLKLELPLSMSDTDLEVLIVVQPAHTGSPALAHWPAGYFEETAGSLALTPLERPVQGHYESRDPLE